MKTISTTFLFALAALTLACGYGKNYMTPSSSGMPVIAQLSPTTATAGGPAFTLTLTGSNFSSQAIVNWNGVAQAANTKDVNAGQVTLSVPAAMIMSASTVQVSVTNPGTPASGMYPGTPAVTSTPMNFTIN